LYVNEALAANTSTLPDEQGEYDDWFELYNASDEPLNAGGLCFTDDEDEPCRWQLPLHFPEQTTIPPHGFLLLWADGQPEQGLFHADFRLSASGEMVAVFQREGAGYGERERLVYAQQSPDVSWGRYPDGSAELRFMYPTPGATNVASGTEEPRVEPLVMWPNPFSERLFIGAGEVEKPYEVMVVNQLGQVVFEVENQWQDTAILQRNAMPAGLYTVVLADARGRRFLGKAVVE
jgi:hypothetical protein